MMTPLREPTEHPSLKEFIRSARQSPCLGPQRGRRVVQAIQGWLAQARTCRKAVQREHRASVQGSEGCVARSVHLRQLEPDSSLYSVHLLVLRSWKNEGFLGHVALLMCYQLIGWAVFQKSCYKGNSACKSSTLVLQA